MTVADFDLGAAAFGPRSNLDYDHDLVAVLDDLLGLCDDLVKCRQTVLPIRLNGLASAVGPRRGRKDQLVIRMLVAKRRIPIAAIDGVLDRPHDLHVLLRHRLLRQPGGCEGASVAAPSVRHHALSAYLHSGRSAVWPGG